MDIKQALMKHNIRLSNGDRWLVMDEIYNLGGEFVVYQRLPYAKRTTEEYRGDDEEEAVQILMNEEPEEE